MEQNQNINPENKTATMSELDLRQAVGELTIYKLQAEVEFARLNNLKAVTTHLEHIINSPDIAEELKTLAKTKLNQYVDLFISDKKA